MVGGSFLAVLALLLSPHAVAASEQADSTKQTALTHSASGLQVCSKCVLRLGLVRGIMHILLCIARLLVRVIRAE